MTEKAIIGWSEYVDFPEWGITGIKAKVDTGARTSALHVEDLQHLDNARVLFHVACSRRPPFQLKEVEADALKWSRVRSSSGHYNERCFVRTRIRIGYIEKDVELSLVSREKMLFRMLLGRKALEHDFWVDVSRRALLTGHRRKRGQ